MILDKYVNIKWHASNKKYLTEKGYVYTGIGTFILIKVSDLKPNSHIKLRVKCDVCGNEKLISYKQYNKNIKSGGYYGCSNICSINKYNKTNLKRYGTKFPQKLEIVKEKMRQTNLKRYGVKNVMKLEIVKDKLKKTNLKKYGVEHNSQSDIIKEKKKETSMRKYGVDSFFKTEKFKEETKKTNLKKYGCENPSQNDEVKKKMKLTNLKKYGVEYAIQSKIVREKVKQTIFRKYGVNFLHQNKEIANKAHNTMIERYGELWLKHVPTYNPNSIIYLDMFSEKLDISIRHALNGGEKKFVKYWVDGYIEKYNICIEWDEKYHKLDNYRKKDIIREKYLIETHGCHIIRINEINFLKDIDNQIIVIIKILSEVIKKIKEKHGKQL